MTIEPRRGAYASQISISDMVEILEVRQNMEGLAAYYAASRMTPENKRKLQKIADKYNEAVIAGDTKEMIHWDTKFHHLIVEGSNNKILVSMVEQLQELVLRFRYLYYDTFKRGEKMPTEHSAIMEAIFNSEPEAARNAADIHIERLKEMVQEDNE